MPALTNQVGNYPVIFALPQMREAQARDFPLAGHIQATSPQLRNDAYHAVPFGQMRQAVDAVTKS